jgi:methylglutaconyl-CoA hydratase
MNKNLILQESVGPGVTRLTLNRPEKRNALSVELMTTLLAALDQVEQDAAQRIVILTGAGPAFCSGLDLDEATGAERTHQSAELIAQCLRRLSESRLVTIAVVRGAALAGGAGLMSACDFVFGEKSARIGYPETRRGLVAALVMIFLRRQLRERDARAILLTGEIFGAERAVAMGLINEVLDESELMPAALKLAETVMAGGPEAVVETKLLLAKLWPSSLADDLATAGSTHAQRRQSAEVQEGIAAFKAKRPPRWLPSR